MRIELDGLGEQIPGFLYASCLVSTFEERPSHQKGLICLRIVGSTLGDGLKLLRQEPHQERVHNVLRDFVLQLEDILKVAVVPLRPHVPAIRSIDELSRDAYSVSRSTHAAFQHISYAELPSHLLHVYRASFVSEARISGDNAER
ncbi:hypothetical protein D9M70_555830 [compost metagenome]